MTILDGYNLLFRDAGAGATLQEQRDEFLRRVDAARPAGERVIVVFDGVPGAGQRRPEIEGLEVRYSRSPRTADDLIVSLVKKVPRHQAIVLTRDRELGHRVRSAGGRLGDPDAFFRGPTRKKPRRGKSEKPKPPTGEQLDEWERLFEELPEEGPEEGEG